MGRAAPIVTGVEWEVDDAAPTWVKSDPLPSDLEATRVWREDRSGVRAAGIADFADAPEPLEQTLVFPLERRVPPASALRPTPLPPAPMPLPAPAPQRSRAFATSVATFSVMAVVLAVALPWILSRLP